jgi:hypothetical protein
MNVPDHISESLKTILGFKIPVLKFFEKFESATLPETHRGFGLLQKVR